MNCQQARQAILIDPQRLAAEVSSHINDCEECHRYHSNTAQWDVRATHEMRRPSKENLTQRVMAAQRLQSARRRMVYSIAASIAVVAIGLAMLLPRATVDNDVGRLMAEHMEEDPLEQGEIDPDAQAQLATIMAKVGASSRGGLPKLLQVQLCPVGQDKMVHAVFEVNGKRVVAFLAHRTGNDSKTRYKQWQGELVAVNGGLMGVFSVDDAAMQVVKTALMNNVTWRAV